MKEIACLPSRRDLGCVATAFAVLVVFFIPTPSSKADPATDLVFFSGELISGRGYAGGGWMHAFSGLDASGVIFSVEGGRPQGVMAYGAGQVGWRFVTNGIYLTFMGGLDAEPRLHPLASADFWWEPARGWMAQAYVEASTRWVSWRVATGWRPNDAWPWIGPEAASSAGWPRAGAHVTGIKLPAGVEARISAGTAWGQKRPAPYCEVSIWRRF